MDPHIQWPYGNSNLYCLPNFSLLYIPLSQGMVSKSTRLLTPETWGVTLDSSFPHPQQQIHVHLLPADPPPVQSVRFSPSPPLLHTLTHAATPFCPRYHTGELSPVTLTPFSILWPKWFKSKTILVLRPTFHQLYSEKYPYFLCHVRPFMS